MQDEDDPTQSLALLTWSPAHGAFLQPRPLAGDQQTLAVGYRGRDLLALAGTSPTGQSCCSSVVAVGPASHGSPGPQRELLSGLAGATAAQLLVTGGRVLAVVGTERGVWVAQASGGGLRFGSPRRLSGRRQLPQAFDAVARGDGRTIVAWAARTDAVTGPGPRTISVSRGASGRPPGGARTLLTVARGHEVDELALAAGPGPPTVAWVESWFDRAGRYHAQVRAADLTARLRPVTLSGAQDAVAGIAFAGGRGGDQILAWKACARSGACAAWATTRRGGAFGRPTRLGTIDAGQSPVTTVTDGGRTVVAWVAGGHVLAATGTTSGPGRPQVVSRTSFASDLALTADAAGGALAVWTQGTLAQSLVAARLSQR